MAGRDLQKDELMYEVGAIVLLFMLNAIVIRVGMMYAGYNGLGLVAMLAASSTAAGVFVYNMTVEVVTNMYEEAMDAEEEADRKRKIQRAIEDDKRYEDAQERSFEKEKRQ